MDLPMTPEIVWQAVLGELQLSLQRPVYDSWLKDTTAVAYEDGCFIVAAKSPFAHEWLEKRMKGMVKQRLQRIVGHSVEVRFIVRAETPSVETQAEPPLLQPAADNGRFRSAPVHQTGAGSTLNPNMTFDTLVEGEGNRFACAAAQAVAQVPAGRYNPLFLYGGVGLGKTHLLHAIGNYAALAGNVVRYVTSETFMNDMIEAIRTRTNASFRQTYRDLDVLLIDDIQFIEGKQSTQNEVFHTFNSLYAANKQIVIASDRPPHLLANLEDRLRSRFGGGLSADLQPPDLEHRIAILRAKAIEGQIAPSTDILRYIAEKYSNSNVRELQGAFNRVTAYARLHAYPLSLELAQQVLGEPKAQLDARPEAILQAVAEEYRVTVAEITGPRRSQRVVEPRQMAMYLMREVCQLSFPQIGETLGGRDHTTIIYGFEKVGQLLQSNTGARLRKDKIELRLRV